MVALVATLFTACNKENEPTTPEEPTVPELPDSKDYIRLEGVSSAVSEFSILQFYGLQTNGSNDLDLYVYAGITKYEMDNMTAETRLENDVYILYLDLGASESDNIPAGTYVVNSDSDRLNGVIVDARIDYLPEGSGPSTTPTRYAIESGSLEVKNENNIYSMEFKGVTKTGKAVIAYYDGNLHYFVVSVN